MTFISVFRIVTLSLSLFFSIVTLGLAAHWTQGSTVLADTVFDFEVVALLAACACVLILPVFLVVAAIRKGAFTTKIVVELPTLFVLCILWLVAAALTAEWSGVLYPFGCAGLLDGSSWCQQFMAIEGLSFVTWILLFIYTATLLTYSLMAHSRGNQVWYQGVNETTFFLQQSAKADLTGGEVPTSQQYQLNPTQRVTPGPAGTPVSVGSHSYHPQV